MNIDVLQKIKASLPSHVTLIAVSKTRTSAEIDEAYQNGCTVFGENKVQEIKAKYNPNYEWHMIGHLQRNKVKDVVPLASMIQSLDSTRLADEIEKQCAKINKVMPVLIEVNISREINKSGISVEELDSFIQYCLQKEHLDVQGLMCVGPLEGDDSDTERCFQQMKQLFDQCKETYGEQYFKYLSMGMSDDYQIAIKHGSNMIRLGTIIFGKRDYSK
ncbi:MAG: YggS family pyridoxal phosphate-dependent enzyme [Longicatena sp.]|nr:YggS family pyridoxal phosphate-dependent enzyme [Longicatena sp.]